MNECDICFESKEDSARLCCCKLTKSICLKCINSLHDSSKCPFCSQLILLEKARKDEGVRSMREVMILFAAEREFKTLGRTIRKDDSDYDGVKVGLSVIFKNKWVSKWVYNIYKSVEDCMFYSSKTSRVVWLVRKGRLWSVSMSSTECSYSSYIDTYQELFVPNTWIVSGLRNFLAKFSRRP